MLLYPHLTSFQTLLSLQTEGDNIQINLSKGLHCNSKPLTGSRLPKHSQKSILISIFGFNEKWLQNWHLANTVEIYGERILINFLLKDCEPWVSAIKWHTCWYRGCIGILELYNKRLLNALQVCFTLLLLAYGHIIIFSIKDCYRQSNFIPFYKLGPFYFNVSWMQAKDPFISNAAFFCLVTRGKGGPRILNWRTFSKWFPLTPQFFFFLGCIDDRLVSVPGYMF